MYYKHASAIFNSLPSSKTKVTLILVYKCHYRPKIIPFWVLSHRLQGLRWSKKCKFMLIVVILLFAYCIHVIISNVILHVLERELCIVLVTLVSCLGLGVEMGLLLGVICNVGHLIYVWARPHIAVSTRKVKNYKLLLCLLYFLIL